MAEPRLYTVDFRAALVQMKTGREKSPSFAPSMVSLVVQLHSLQFAKAGPDLGWHEIWS